MKSRAPLYIGIVLAALLPAAAAERAPDDVLKAAPAGDWQAIDPSNLVVVRLASANGVAAGRVVIELAPDFAPQSIGNIRTLIKARYFDGSFVIRAQDNFVVQWAQDDAREKQAPPLKGKAEFERPLTAGFVALGDPDTYAPKTGFDGGFPAASDGKQEWLVHCYGMVAVARDIAPDSGTGVELYAVIGQAPRQLDRNFTVIGRIVQGVENLSVSPRGTGALGFYEKPRQRLPVAAMRIASDLPKAEQPGLEVLKTGSATFHAYVDARRNRKGMFIHPAGRLDVCNVPVPVREAQRTP